MEPPYIVPHPKELTHRLHTNWLSRRVQNRQSSHCSEPAHVEQNVPSTCNKDNNDNSKAINMGDSLRKAIALVKQVGDSTAL
jgi:hypothetical protein